jgi:selenocysteine lyase/cysteine desulfurase
MNNIEFGEKTRHDHYLMDQDVVYANHGSYGPCPRVVYEELQRIRLQQEQNPDRWFRSLKYTLYVDCVRAAADRLNCNFEQITLVDNATVGINAILNSPLPTFTSKSGGTILCTNLAYGSVLFTIEETAKQRGMSIRMINIQLPIVSKQAFIEQFENELNKGDVENIRLAVIDHITSATAILFPIDELTVLFHSHGIPVVVDGAHGPGQVNPNLSLDKLACDFYIGTFHKWMYAARGCSFLFVREPTIASLMQPGNTSWGYRPSKLQLDVMTHFHLQFFHQGTRDESALFTLPKAIDFVDSMAGGFDRIYQYNSTLSEQAKVLLEQRWNTQGKVLFPDDMQAPYLKMIQLPDLEEYAKTDADALRLLTDLIEHHKLVSIILCVNDELYVRIATQIYNRIEDYIFLADTIDRFRKNKNN